MSSTPTGSDRSATESKAPSILISLAVVVAGILTLYYGWHFHASFQPSHGDPNILGTGWILQAMFFVLNRIPSLALGMTAVVLGGLALYGNSLPIKTEPPAVSENVEGPVSRMPPGSSGLRLG